MHNRHDKACLQSCCPQAEQLLHPVDGWKGEQEALLIEALVLSGFGCAQVCTQTPLVAT